MYLLGIDLGSSSIKLAVIESITGEVLAKCQFPETEMQISSPIAGWAEQSPNDWWNNFKLGLQLISKQIDLKMIGAIGISYQMHGLVCIDKNKDVLRPSIIWCDSRAVEIGKRAFTEIGEKNCLRDLLNSPGNFTASKLAWVKYNEPQLFDKIDKILLPGDYIAMRLSGEANTTISGLSEGVFWDFTNSTPSEILLNYYGISSEMLPSIVPTFGNQCLVSKKASEELGLKPGTLIAYRAGDQPNNAFSLNVLNPGEIAASAGTSGVVYAISNRQQSDPKSRVNIFAHVTHEKSNPHYGILLCINGVGILNSWLKKNIVNQKISYIEMNEIASKAPIGSNGLVVLPFGNGAERILENKEIGSHFCNLNFNNHTTSHILRASQEGIAFAFMFGLEIMQKHNGLTLKTIRAGHDNMFLSPVFRETLASITQQPIEIYDTNGAIGAARGAGFGAGEYKNIQEAFSNLTKIITVEPNKDKYHDYFEAYTNWNKVILKFV